MEIKFIRNRRSLTFFVQELYQDQVQDVCATPSPRNCFHMISKKVQKSLVIIKIFIVMTKIFTIGIFLFFFIRSIHPQYINYSSRVQSIP